MANLAVLDADGVEQSVPTITELIAELQTLFGAQETALTIGGVDVSDSAPLPVQQAQLTAANDSVNVGTVAGVAPTTPGKLNVVAAVGDLNLPETAESTLLSSAARTATAFSADQTNRHCRGIRVYLNITAASGTGGLAIVLQEKDPVSGGYFDMNTAATAVTTTGLKVYVFGPALTGGAATQNVSTQIPRTFRAKVVHSDGSSYTYSVAVCLLP